MRLRVTGGLVLAGCALATAGSVDAAPRYRPPAQVFEANLSRDPAFSNGEPSIAVNPRNPRNIVATYLLNTFFGSHNAYHQQPPALRHLQQPLQGCNVAVTFDAGRTWQHQRIPVSAFESDLAEPNCSDSLVVFDSRGKAYLVAAVFNTAFAYGEHRVITSTDGGRSWSPPAIVAPTSFSDGAQPLSDGAKFYNDRQWIAVDDRTGTVYVEGTQGRLDPQSQGVIVWLAASHDGGKSFGYPIVTGASGSAPLAAGHGVVMVPTTDEECSCVALVVSRDRGRSVTRLRTPIGAGSGRAQLYADPTRAGRFVLMQLNAEGERLEVFRTNDYGRTWSKPATLSTPDAVPFKTWLTMSHQGVVGVGWRARYADGTYDFWASYSLDTGLTFAKPVRLSKAVSPMNDVYLTVGGDDTSSVAVNGDWLYASWGDWRGGEGEDVWWGGLRFRR